MLPTLLLALTTQTASAADTVRQAGNFGLGLGGGNFVSGISMKYFMSDDTAIEGLLGSWGFGGLGVSAALLFEMPNLVEEDDFNLAWSVGPGVAFWTYTYDGFGEYSYNAFAITAVLGLEMNLNEVPLDIVIEWRPGIYISSVTAGVYDNDGAVASFGGFGGHIRYYF
jgi:hypothetical protein